MRNKVGGLLALLTLSAIAALGNTAQASSVGVLDAGMPVGITNPVSTTTEGEVAYPAVFPNFALPSAGAIKWRIIFSQDGTPIAAKDILRGDYDARVAMIRDRARSIGKTVTISVNPESNDTYCSDAAESREQCAAAMNRVSNILVDGGSQNIMLEQDFNFPLAPRQNLRDYFAGPLIKVVGFDYYVDGPYLASRPVPSPAELRFKVMAALAPLGFTQAVYSKLGIYHDTGFNSSQWLKDYAADQAANPGVITEADFYTGADESSPLILTNDDLAVINGMNTSSTVVRGDINGDGKVDIRDATMALQSAVGLIQPSDMQLRAADLNGNGKIDIADVTAILKMAVGL